MSQPSCMLSPLTPKTKTNADHANHMSRVYFRQEEVQFGRVRVGSLNRVKVDLCNATSEEVTVSVEDLSLPFVVVHHEIRLRAKSFVRIPVRFVPPSAKQFAAQLCVCTKNVSGQTVASASTVLKGAAYDV